MSTIQQEIHQAIDDIQKKLNAQNDLTDKDMEMLLLSSLIEEEA
jgi:hypothetical protein